MRDRSASRRAGRGLTTRGRCLLAGGVAAIICAVVLDERDLLRVGLFACALPIIAVAITALRGTQLTAEHQVFPERLRPGSRGQVVLALSNAGQTRTPSIDIAEAPTPGLTAGMRFLIPAIRRGHAYRVHYPIVASQRGRFVLGPPQLRVYDPFDLWEEHRTLSARTEVLVVPTVVPLMGMPSSSGARSAASGRTTVGTIGGDPDVGVRPYRSGDDIRTIHWRASARHDELVVRLEEPVSHGGATLLLDHRAIAHRGAGPESSLEIGVVMTASIAIHLLAADHQVRLISHQGTVIAEGHDIADDVLAGLATVELDRTAQLRPLALGRSGLLIAVLGEMTADDARALAAARHRSLNAVALVLQTEDWEAGARSGSAAGAESGRRPSAADRTMPTAARILGAAGWRVVVVRAGDDLATAWRRACAIGDGYLSGARRVS